MQVDMFETHTQQHTNPRNLIVNYIPTPVTSDELWQLFEQYGEVESARVILDPKTQHPKGYGFVLFKSETCAANAIKNMNGFEIHGKRLKVTVAHGHRRRLPQVKLWGELVIVNGVPMFIVNSA
jgi:RNA recognition motif-containing protein